MPRKDDPFRYAEGERVKITESQRREIKKLYQEVADDLKKDLRRLEGRDDISSALRRRYLSSLKESLGEGLKSVDKKTEKIVRKNMDKMVAAVMENNQRFLNDLGLNGYRNDPSLQADVVSRIVSGKLYDGKWTLSKVIWGDDKKKLDEINRIVAKGILENRGVYDIAKDLERYVNPRARKDWNWSNMFPGSRRKIDYNAQRLARTMVSHAYEESFVNVTKNNPFIEAYRWLTSGSDRVCPICIDRSEDDKYGLGAGIFPKDRLPLDHPNGMCTFEVVMTMDGKEIAETIADWYLGEGDEKMNKKIDRFVKDLKRF